MSTETPERPKSVYQRRREAIAAAIKTWQEADTSDASPTAAAGDLEEALREQGLILLPSAPDDSNWRVLVDGKPAPGPDGGNFRGPVDAETAADVFLTQAAADSGGERRIVVRQATNAELVHSAVLGDGTVREDPIRIAPTLCVLLPARGGGDRHVLVLTGDGGPEVQVELGPDQMDIFAGLFDAPEDVDVDDETGGAE